jgi:hypothetical protein
MQAITFAPKGATSGAEGTVMTLNQGGAPR